MKNEQGKIGGKSVQPFQWRHISWLKQNYAVMRMRNLSSACISVIATDA